MPKNPFYAGKIKARGSIGSLCSQPRRESPKESTDWVRFLKHAGIEEEAQAGLGDSLIGVVPWNAVAREFGEAPRPALGQCGEHVRIASGNFTVLNPGDLLGIGSALLEVTRLGRSCPGPCPLGGMEPGTCPLAKAWITARVMKSGQACVEDPVVAMGMGIPPRSSLGRKQKAAIG